MILSALLTSVGVNVALCLLFLTLYSLLKNKQIYAHIYLPRLVSEGISQLGDGYSFEGILPSVNWVKRAWQLSEEELLANSGFDAMVFMRIFTFSLRVFSFAAIIGICVLLPFNYMGNQLNADFTGLSNKSLESFSISNVDDGSNRLWIHFCAVYVFTSVVCYFLYSEYDYISSKRIGYFYSSKPRPNQFTVLVRSIPKSSGRSFSESVESFFTEYYPSTYLSHYVVLRTSKLKGLINNADKLYKKISHLKSKNDAQKRFGRAGFMGLFGKRVDLLDSYEKKLETMEDNVRTERSTSAGKELPAAFVSFKSRFSAAITTHIRQGVKPTEWITEPAPDPQDVNWPFFAASSFLKKWISNLAVIVAFVLITILFLLPVILVQGLTNLEQLETWFPFLKGILSLKIISQLVTGYLPSLILQMFLSFVPPVMVVLSSIQGYIALSQIEKSACRKVLWFFIWNIFFANVLSGSALYRAEVFLEPKRIPEILAVAVPGQASFFIAYVVTSGWTKTVKELFKPLPVVWNSLKSIICGNSDEELEVSSIPYHSEIPRILFFSLLGVTYFFLAPLILPFLLGYYCLGYIIYRNLLLNVYAPKFETGGKFWPVVYDSTIFALLLMHLIAIGIFGLKKVPLASSLTIPLPILTLAFNSYCQRRFQPMFESFPAECLIRKDRYDQNDPTLASFHDKLVTAYQDPAMNSVRYSGNSDRINSPLLHSDEI